MLNNTKAYLSIDIFNQFVQVLVPRIGTHVVEITTHRHDDVICGIVRHL